MFFFVNQTCYDNNKKKPEGGWNKNPPLKQLREICTFDTNPNIYMTSSDTSKSTATRLPSNKNIKSILIIMMGYCVIKSYFSFFRRF